MEWVILTFIMFALTTFLLAKALTLLPTHYTIVMNPPQIVTERFNSLPATYQSTALGIIEKMNFTVSTTQNNVTIIFPKFMVNKTTSTG